MRPHPAVQGLRRSKFYRVDKTTSGRALTADEPTPDAGAQIPARAGARRARLCGPVGAAADVLGTVGARGQPVPSLGFQMCSALASTLAQREDAAGFRG